MNRDFFTQLPLYDCSARSLSEGSRLRDEGKARVAAKNRAFIDQMRSEARCISRRDGSVSIDALRSYAESIEWEPTHRNAWGTVFKGRGWKAIGWQQSRIPTNRARVIRVWRWEGE